MSEAAKGMWQHRCGYQAAEASHDVHAWCSNEVCHASSAPDAPKLGYWLDFLQKLCVSAGFFYRGCFVNAVNSGPAAAIVFVANDYLKAMVS